MTSSLWRFGVVLLLAASAALYLHALDRSPVYLGLDEAHFAVHARAIADTGRNLNGDPLPLFVNLADPLGDQPTLTWGASWYHPLLFYLIALALKVLPFTEASVRTPTALIAGVLSVALIHAVAMRLFRARWIAAACAVMLALTPAQLVLGRQALDYVCPLPFQLGWLWCLLACRDSRKPSLAFASGLILGLGCYSYVSSWFLMPAFLAVSWVVLRSTSCGPRAIVAAATGFVLPVLLLVPWLWFHPRMMNNLLASQSLTAADTFGRRLAMAKVTQLTLATYWSYFNPAFLFLTGGPSLNAATGQAGVFLLPIAVLLPIGLAAMFRHPRLGSVKWVLLLGLLITPIPATLKGAPHVIQRALSLLPFAILICGCGLWALWQWSRLARATAIVLLIAMPLQFAFFYADYLSGYRLRSASAYDRTAFAETARVLLDAESDGTVPLIYLTAPLFDVSAKWRFYATKAGRTDLLPRTRYFNGDLATIDDASSGALAVVEPENPHINAALTSGDWSIERRVVDVAERESLTILRKR